MSTTIKHTLGVRIYRPPARAFFRFVYRVLTNLHIEGMENIPSCSGYLLTINHLSLYDPPLPLSFWPYAPEALGAEKTMYNNGIIGIIMRWYGTFPVKRDGDDRTALRTALKILQNDLPLLIAPEGTRHPEGLRNPQHGASFLAMKTGVPLIPVAISGTADIFSKLRKGSKAIISMVIGKPYNLPNLPDTSRRDAIRIHTDYIMQKIADLLPDHHRGMYKKQ